MSSDNWVVQNLQYALTFWNDKLSEIYQILTESPTTFRDGEIWQIISNIHGALQAIGFALLVLFFLCGVMKTCGSLSEVKRPEVAFKLFIRFAIAKGIVTYGMDIMMAIFKIMQGVISTIMQTAGLGRYGSLMLPITIIHAIEDCGFLESIPLWAVTIIGVLVITALSIVMILTVYGRFFKIYMYTAISPLPLSTCASESTQNIAKSFIKSYTAVCLEGAIIMLKCQII